MRTETRKHGELAAGCALSEAQRVQSEAGELHVLNSGKAYGGEMLLRGVIRIRQNPNVAGELIMLGDHNRRVILGAWTGARVDGNQVVAEGFRWASAEVEPNVTRYRGLVDEKLLWGVSIGFRGRWYWVADLPDSDPAKESGAVWLIEGTEEHPIEVYEASLVTIGADGESMITYALAEGEPPPIERDAALELDEEEVETVESVAAQLMAAHLQEHHDLEAEEAEAQVRAMLEGERVEEDGEPAEEADAETSLDSGTELTDDGGGTESIEEAPGEGAEPTAADESFTEGEEETAAPPQTLSDWWSTGSTSNDVDPLTAWWG